MTFGKTIKDLRLKNNMTQEKLAELLNISPQAVSRWEKQTQGDGVVVRIKQTIETPTLQHKFSNRDVGIC